LASLEPVDVIDGDFTLSKINVLSRSNFRCANDEYVKGTEMLVFLEPEDSLYRTSNFQFGQFEIEGEIVRGWRDKENKISDKPYAEVRREIESYVRGIRNPKPQPTPVPPPAVPKPPSPTTGSF
jgi:hypothetical protein